MLQCKEQIIRLFNAGKLTKESERWYNQRGYMLVHAGGKVVDIVERKQKNPGLFSK